MKRVFAVALLLFFAITQCYPSVSLAEEPVVIDPAASSVPVKEYSSFDSSSVQPQENTVQTSTEFLTISDSISPSQTQEIVNPFLDTDGDFIPDVWEQAHGLNAQDANDKQQDSDGDKLTNLEEYLIDTDPLTETTEISDEKLIQLYERKASLFFWGEARESNHFLVPDRTLADGGIPANAFVSVAGVGFQLASYVVNDERGWQDHKETYDRVLAILQYMRSLQSPDQEGSSHKRGVYYHFLDFSGHGLSEVSPIDHALFLSGALLAGEYYKGTEVERLAREIYDNTDWTFFLNPQGFLYLGWYPDWYNHQGGYIEGGNWGNFDSWNRYSEESVMYMLAAGSNTHPIPNARQVWNNISRPTVQYTSPVTGQAFAPYVHVGSLFAHQYSQAFVDFRGTRDDAGVDYFYNSQVASLVNRRFAFDLNDQDSGRYNTYVHNNQEDAGVWGLSAADRSDGYGVIQPEFSIDPWLVEINNDSGTVVPGVAIASMPFIPSELLRDLRFMFENRDTLFPFSSINGIYGFVNSYNSGQALSGTFYQSPWVIGIDLGTVVLNLENYRSGTPWKFFMQNPEIQRGMNLLGFVETDRPFIMNFDNGADPNSFGGYGGGFGPTPATRNYVDIGDPFSDQNYGPQGYAQEMTGLTAGDGVWLGLANHDVSRWDRVSFWIRGAQGGEDIRIGLKDADQIEVQVSLNDYLPGGMTAEWQEVRIPLSIFRDQGLRLVSMDNISFTFAGSDAGKIFVDDIAFLGDEFPPSAVQNLTTSVDVSTSTVQLNWDWNPEPDVVGYRILRKTLNDSDFVDMTPSGLLWVDNIFQDNLSGIEGDVIYQVLAVDNSVFSNQSEPASVTVNLIPAVPQGWVRAPSNIYFAFRIRTEQETSKQFLDLMDLRLGDMQTLVSVSLPSQNLSNSVYDVTAEGQTVIYGIDLGAQSSPRFRAYLQRINDPSVKKIVSFQGLLQSISFNPDGTVTLAVQKIENGLTYQYAYHVNLETLKIVRREDFVYEAGGVLQRHINYVYRLDGKTVRLSQDYRYVNGVLKNLYERYMTHNGRLQRKVNYAYYADGQTVKVKDVYRYTRGKRIQFRYDASGQLISKKIFNI